VCDSYVTNHRIDKELSTQPQEPPAALAAGRVRWVEPGHGWPGGEVVVQNTAPPRGQRGRDRWHHISYG
jgi:hypothetical protein